MNAFVPSFQMDRVTAITPEFLRENEIEALVLDVDNTLTTHGNPVPGDGVPEWLDTIRAAGIPMLILSNNSRARVAPFAELLDLPYIARGFKPLKLGLTKACKLLGLPPQRVAIVGDQLFTDILGGNRKGIKTILTQPISPESGWFFRLKRKMEDRLIKQ